MNRLENNTAANVIQYNERTYFIIKHYMKLIKRKSL
jgi:hypothetical protein